MFINFKKELGRFQGQDITWGAEQKATLAHVAIDALIALRADEALSGEEKMRRYLLAEKIIVANEPLDLSIEDVAYIKSLCGKHPSPLIVGRAWSALENQGESNA